MKRVLDFITLFASAGTLVCCALPALLVAIGAGSVMASLVSHVPQLIWLSEHKLAVFIFAGVMLVIGGWVQWYTRNQPCPIDPVKARACKVGRKWSRYIYMVSIVIYLVGGFFAFFAARFI